MKLRLAKLADFCRVRDVPETLYNKKSGQFNGWEGTFMSFQHIFTHKTVRKKRSVKETATRVGFEPTHAECNRFAVHHLNLSVTSFQRAAIFIVYTFVYSLEYLIFRMCRSCLQKILFLRVRRSNVNTNDLLPPQSRGKENNQ